MKDHTAEGGAHRHKTAVPRTTSHGSSLPELSAKWKDIATLLERFSASAQAAAIRQCAVELDVAIREEEDRLLSLSDASDLSGYSRDHLSRMIRAGVLPNAGRKGKPLVRLRDVPVRPKKLHPSTTKRYDPALDALALASRGGGKR